MNVASYVDLTRHARAVEGLADMGEVASGLSRNMHDNVLLQAHVERKELTAVIDAATTDPHAFVTPGANSLDDVAQGVQLLRDAERDLGRVDALPRAQARRGAQAARPTGWTRLYGFVPARTYSPTGASEHLRSAAERIRLAHAKLGGTRELPELPRMTASATNATPPPAFAPASDPRLNGTAAKRRQQLVFAKLEPLLRRMGFRDYGPQVPASGPVAVFGNHLSPMDPFFQSLGTARAGRGMYDGRFDSQLGGLFGRILSGLGGFPVSKGTGSGGAEGLAVYRSLLDQGEQVLVYPQGRVVPIDGLTPLAPSTIRAVLELNARQADDSKLVKLLAMGADGYQSKQFRAAGDTARHKVTMRDAAIDLGRVEPTDDNVALVRELLSRRVEAMRVGARERRLDMDSKLDAVRAARASGAAGQGG